LDVSVIVAQVLAGVKGGATPLKLAEVSTSAPTIEPGLFEPVSTGNGL
jgi:hypothetical protein